MAACMYDKETPQRLPNHKLEDENLSLPVDDLISKKTVKEEVAQLCLPGKCRELRRWGREWRD